MKTSLLLAFKQGQGRQVPLGFLGLTVTGRPAKGYYPALQGLRGFSAVSVFLVHIYRMSSNGGFLPPLPALAHVIWSTLGTGVGLFFLISGFVIPGSLARHNDLVRFFIDRLLRIMPLFILIHIVVFTAGLAVGYKWLAHITPSRYVELFVTNITFTALPLGLPLLQQNSWSLTYEWAFYISLAMLWFLKNHRYGFGLVGDGMVILLVATACWLFPLCLYFVVGVCIAQVRLDWALLDRYSGLAIICEGLFALACLVFYFGLAQFSSVLLAVVPASVIFLLSLQQGSLTSKTFSLPILMWLGKVSFSLYLLHPLLMYPLQSLLGHLAQHGHSKFLLLVLFSFASTVIVMPLSLLSYTLVEVRLRTILHEVCGRRVGVEPTPKNDLLGDVPVGANWRLESSP